MIELARLLADFGERQVKKTCSVLLSPEPDAEKVRRWLKKHARPFSVGFLTVSGEPLENWEIELWALAIYIHLSSSPLGKWEKASAETRKAHGRGVSRLARDLADALNEDMRPYYPPVLEFFDEERALDMIRCLPEDIAAPLLDGTGHTLQKRVYERTELPLYEGHRGKFWRSPRLQLMRAFSMPEPQKFPSLLRRLADYAEARISDPKSDHRPSVPGANVRAFARELAGYFLQSFHKAPNAIIAACVQLYFPTSEATAETIREWRGAK